MAEDWRPYIETCIEAFGAAALHVREQLPGRQGHVQLRRPVERLQAHRRRRSAAEKAALFHDTAARFYNLPGV